MVNPKRRNLGQVLVLKLSTEQEYKLTMKWIKTSFYDLIINNISS